MSARAHTVVVLLDTPGSALRSPAKELLTLARPLGGVVAVALAEPSAQVVAEASELGAERLLVVDPAGDVALTPVVAEALAVAVRAVGADVALLTSSFQNKEAAALLAHELGAGLVVDARPDLVEGRVLATKRVFAGSWDVVSEASSDQVVLTVRANETVAEPVGQPVPLTPEHLSAAPSPRATAAALVSRTVHPVSADARPALAEAAIVVAGGRGTLGDFAPVHDLADALGAAVGATRDAVDEGWVEHDAQIGQTGVTIAPRVYIGAGISGAPHHRGGMQASGTIITVNSDPEAPLVEISDLAVVGDLADVLPQAAAAIREHLAERGR